MMEHKQLSRGVTQHKFLICFFILVESPFIYIHIVLYHRWM